MGTRKTIEFRHIEVKKDGDPVGQGEIAYDFEVNGHTVASGGPVKAGNNSSISINQSLPVLLDDEDSLIITGSVYDIDNGSKNEGGTFRHVYQKRGNNWGSGPHTIKINDRRKFAVEVDYNIS